MWRGVRWGVIRARIEEVRARCSCPAVTETACAILCQAPTATAVPQYVPHGLGIGCLSHLGTDGRTQGGHGPKCRKLQRSAQGGGQSYGLALGLEAALMCLSCLISSVTSSAGSVLSQNECCLVIDVWEGGQESTGFAGACEECQLTDGLMAFSLGAMGALGIWCPGMGIQAGQGVRFCLAAIPR